MKEFDDVDKEVLHFYSLITKRIHKGSKAVVFNQAAEMMFQLDAMIEMGYENDVIVEFVRSWRDMLYDYP